MEDQNKLKDALSLWQERELNRAEAVSNADPHVFPQSFIHETLEKMENAEEKTKRPPKSSFLEKANVSNKMLGMVAMAAVLVLLIIPLATNALSNLNGDRALIDSAGTTPTAQASVEVAQEELEAAPNMAMKENEVETSAAGEAVGDSQSPLEPTASVTIPTGYFDVAGGVITFADPTTGVIYRIVPGESPQELVNVKAQMDAHAGIERFGVQEETIYIAFNDGRGAVIEGNPLVVTDSRYWHEEWFSENEELPASVEDGVIYDDTQYLFENE